MVRPRDLARSVIISRQGVHEREFGAGEKTPLGVYRFYIARYNSSIQRRNRTDNRCEHS
jgi:hypothetical protein